MKGTLHVVGLPHTETTDDFATCAYTQKVVKFCRMMHGRDRRVILYAGERNDAPCDEHVTCVTRDQQERWFGEHRKGDLDRGGFNWDAASPWWQAFNAATIGEVARRMEPTDLLLLLAGTAQQIVADALPTLIVAEWGVGYEGIISKRAGGTPSPALAAFESHTHRHLVYGKYGWQNVHHNGRALDTVIPNYFDLDELPAGAGGDYLLFVGRLIWNKGAHIAAKIAEHLDMPIVVAGPGATAYGEGWVDYPEGRAAAPKLEYVGPVGIEERARLMGGAAATIAATMYVEPFGGVAVESMICGTPVVTTDFGAFVETVAQGTSGYRFQTMQEAVAATEAAIVLPRDRVREYAVARYSLDAIRPAYDRWFGNLDRLWTHNWDSVDASPAAATLTP